MNMACRLVAGKQKSAVGNVELALLLCRCYGAAVPSGGG
jgi:hypothetical protein